ncbi:MAG: hypothetical protein ACRD0Z_06110 [Acidimicrobiales bacterium]
MTQPKFAPIIEDSEVRQSMKVPTPLPWVAHRPADYLPEPTAPRKPNTGIPGPDQGYALALAERFAPKLQLSGYEHAADVLAGAVAIALRRASLYGRAPVSGDIELALCLFGFLGEAPAELVEARGRAFGGSHHDYWQQRDLADFVPESTLRLTPAAVRDLLGVDPSSWRTLSGVPS